MEHFSIQKAPFLLAALRITLATVTVFQRVDDNFIQERETSAEFISCSYDNTDAPSNTGHVPVDMSDLGDMVLNGDSVFNVYKVSEPERDRVNYEKCVLCSFHSIKCADNVNLAGKLVCFRRSIYKGNQKGGRCEKHIVSVKGYLGSNIVKRSSDEQRRQGEAKVAFENETVGEYSKDIVIPIGKSNGRSRQERFTGYCSLPSYLLTADAHCKIYPKVIKCIQRCAFGYTLDSGIRQKIECNVKDGQWKPAKFNECKPFVDCTLSLKSGGSLACSTSSVLDSPECRVSCLHYEDKDAVGAQNYTCNIEGKWDPPLPFCVTPGSGLMLTHAPHVKLHETSKTK